MRYFLKLFLCLFLVLPIYAQAGSSTDDVQLIQTDLAATQLSAYYDLRERHSYIQVTNVTSSNVNIHVQIFQQDRGCTELNFDDTLTGNDTVVYDLENLIKNNGNPAPVNLQDDSYGYVVVTDRVVDSETSSQRRTVFAMLQKFQKDNYRHVEVRKIVVFRGSNLLKNM